MANKAKYLLAFCFLIGSSCTAFSQKQQALAQDSALYRIAIRNFFEYDSLQISQHLFGDISKRSLLFAEYNRDTQLRDDFKVKASTRILTMQRATLANVESRLKEFPGRPVWGIEVWPMQLDKGRLAVRVTSISYSYDESADERGKTPLLLGYGENFVTYFRFDCKLDGYVAQPGRWLGKY